MSKLTDIYKDVVNEENNIYSVSEYGDDYLFEANFGKIHDHSKNGFMIISSFKLDTNDEFNKENLYDLKEELKDLSLGYFELDGTYKHMDKYQNLIYRTSKEISLFVPYRDIYTMEEFEEIAIDLANRFDQESVTFSKGENNPIYKIKSNGGKEIIGHKLVFDKMGLNYSTMKSGRHKGRSFTIEGVRIPIDSKQSYLFKKHKILW